MIVSLAGAVALPLIGFLRVQTGGYAVSMAMLASLLVLSSFLVLSLGRILAPRNAAARSEVGSVG